MSCFCKVLDRGESDVFSKAHFRDNGVVVHSRVLHSIESCACCGHRIEPLTKMLCAETPLISSALKSGHLELLMRFDVSGHIVDIE
jgi:hypothetical protein